MFKCSLKLITFLLLELDNIVYPNRPCLVDGDSGKKTALLSDGTILFILISYLWNFFKSCFLLRL